MRHRWPTQHRLPLRYAVSHYSAQFTNSVFMLPILGQEDASRMRGVRSCLLPRPPFRKGLDRTARRTRRTRRTRTKDQNQDSHQITILLHDDEQRADSAERLMGFAEPAQNQDTEPARSQDSHQIARLERPSVACPGHQHRAALWRAVGAVDVLIEKARSLGQCWLKGAGASAVRKLKQGA